MQTRLKDTKNIRLIRGRLEPNGSHSNERLVKALARGNFLRVRRGVYVAAQDWFSSPPWVRYEIVLTAIAMTKEPVFCRQSALLLHGLPLISTPEVIYARTRDRGTAKTRPAPQMTGSVPVNEFLRRYMAAHPESEASAAASLRNIPLDLLEPSCPASMTRTEARKNLRLQKLNIPQVRIQPDSLLSVQGPPQGFQAEPLALAAVDTASRLPFTEAVVILDAVKARQDADVSEWLNYLKTKRQRNNWDRAWQFADPRSESPLESESRAVLHEIGAPPPILQRVFHTRLGGIRFDFAWEKERIAGEVDGKAKYFDPDLMNGNSAAEVHYLEKQRREAAEEQGWTFVRWGKSELRNRQLLIKKLARAGLRPVT
ncbi:hypothetical protein [Nesterenkonia ebinurensis]|uniref:hypothetical protein n=1 Tax=Nesterenkonia ebinurensis TaxID=2608252 RepID=UPI00123DAEF6|nr:hypothetical protein [Nesterenkonia ebinurensis]